MQLADRDGLTPDQRYLSAQQWACENDRPEETSAGARDHRSAFAGKVSYQWRGGEHAGVRRGLQLQAWLADGEACRQSLQGLVKAGVRAGQAGPLEGRFVTTVASARNVNIAGRWAAVYG